MKKIFLVGILLSISVLVGFGQRIKVSLQPSVVNGYLEVAILAQNNTSLPVALAECEFEAFVDTNFVSYSSMVLSYANPRWSDNNFYDKMTLSVLPTPDNNTFRLAVNPFTSILNTNTPETSAYLQKEETATVGRIRFQLKKPCEDAEINYGWTKPVFRKWEKGILMPDREMNLELEPDLNSDFNFSALTPITSTLTNNAFVTSLSANIVVFGWNPVPDAIDYRVRYNINGGGFSAWQNTAGLSYSLTTNDGDIVEFQYGAVLPKCEFSQSQLTKVIAYDCSAGFSGLRPTTETYCTSSFKDIIAADADNLPGSYTFQGPGVNWGAGVWYFDPQQAGPGSHLVTMIGCYGADTVSEPTTVLPAPCSETINETTLSVPFGQPQGIYTDCLGQVYFSEFRDKTIIKIDTFGVGTAVVGVNGDQGFLDGPNSTALIQSAVGVVTNPVNGVLYFADFGNNAVREYDPGTGLVTTLVGGGPSSNLGINANGLSGDSDNPADYANNRMFDGPFGLALNLTYDTLFVSDQKNNKIKAISLLDNSVVTIAGTGAVGINNGDGVTAATFAKPANISVQGSNIFIADETANQVRVYNSSTKLVSTYLGDGSAGFVDGEVNTQAKFDGVIDVASDGQGVLFFLEKDNCALRRVKEDSVKTFIGDPSALPFAKCGSAPNQLNGPTAMSFYVNGFIDIVDTDNDRVVRWAIEDFLSSPNSKLDSVYCVNSDLDTLNSSNISGFYTSSPTGYVLNNGTHWVFDPSKGAGNVTVSFNHQVGLCQGTEDRTVYVAPLPSFDLGNDTLICAGSFGVDQLEVDSTLGAYQWSFKPLNSSIITAAVADTNHNIPIDSLGTYYLTVTSPFGCIYDDSISISQRNPALLQIASTSGAIDTDSICFNENTTLTVTNNEPTSPGFASILWNIGEVTQSITVDTSGQYIVNIIDSLGCTAADTFDLVKKVRPSATIDVSPSNLTGVKTYMVCPEDTALLNGGSNNGITYSWSDSTIVGGISEVSTDSLLLVTSTGKFYLEVDFADGCIGTDSVIIENYTIPVINLDTTTRVTGGPDALTICREDSVLLKANPVAVGYAYEWKDINGIVVSNTPNFNAKVAGTYYLKITTNNGCELFDTIAINNFVATVNLGSDQTICQRDFYTFDAGAPYYSYLWSDNSNGQTLTVSDSGIYGVTVVTNDGCLATDSVELTVLIPDSVDVLPDTPVTICNLDSTLLSTSLSSTATGTYSWTDGSVGAANYVSTAGYQVVTFTDGITGCTSLDSTLITVIARPVFDTLTVDSTICRSDTLPLFVQSALASDSVFIYGLNTTTNIRTLVASDVYQTTFDGVDTSDIGTYVYVADNGFCTTEFTSNINVTDLTTTIIPPSDTICFGDSLLMTLSTSGGKGAYSYEWSQNVSNNNTSTSNTNQPSYYATPGNAGNINTYRVRVKDAVGCFAYDTVGYYYNTPVVAEIEGGLDSIAICGNGVNNAFEILDVSATGGLGGYQYKWSIRPSDVGVIQLGDDFVDTILVEILSPIPDTVPVFVYAEDQYGCSDRDTVIFGLTVVTIGASVQHDVICPNLSDSLSIIVREAPVGELFYSWTKQSLSASKILTPSAKQGVNVSATAPGTYRFTGYMKHLASGCEADTSVFVSVKPISGLVSKNKSIICDGDTAFLEASGSVGAVEYNTSVWPYSHKYQWSKVSGSDLSVFINGNNSVGVQITDGLPGSTSQYQLIVTDSIGCMDTVVTDVVWNNTINPQVQEDTFYVCNDAVTPIYSNATGGSTNTGFNYNWTRIAGNVILPDAGGISANNNQNPSVYFNVDSISDTSVVTLRVTDPIGCFAYDTTTIINNNLDFEINPRFNPICADFPNKLLVAFLRDSNATGNYTFIWNDPADANDLYQDSLGTTLNTSIRSPYAITDNTQSYELSITDNVSGCSNTASGEVTIYNLDAVITIDVQIKDTSAICYLDQIVLKSDSSKGGTLFSNPVAPYIYNWYRSPTSTDNSAATTATDGRDVSIAAFGSEGDYTTWILELTDKLGCKGFDSTTIYWNPELKPTLVDDTVYVCTPDTALLSINTATSGGGTSPYNYVWSKTISPGGAAVLLDSIGTDVRVSSIDNDTTIFTVEMTDDYNCSATKNVVVIGVDYRIDAIASDYSVCQNINVQLDVNFLEDSIGNFSYNWSPDIGLNDFTMKSPTLTSDSTRTYTVVVYDSVFKCSATDSLEVQVLDLTAVASDRIGLDSIVMCAYQDSLVIDGRTTFGGTPPYSFSWNTFSNPEVNVIGGTTADTIVLTRGLVTPIDTTLLILTAEDQNGCIDIDSVAIYWNSPVIASIFEDSLYICNNTPKSLTAVTPTGGTGTYSYGWSALSGLVTLPTDTTTNTININTVDNDISYIQLQVLDNLGCAGFDTVKVEGMNFQVEASAKYGNICVGSIDSLSVIPLNDGIGGYSYVWTPNTAINNVSIINPVVNPIVDTDYTVTVYDSTTGCSAQDVVSITMYELNASAGLPGLDTLFQCNEDNETIFIDASLTNGGISPYSYSWNTFSSSEATVVGTTNGDTLQLMRGLVTPIDTTLISVTVSDQNGCFDSDSIVIYWNSAITANILEDSLYICNNTFKSLTAATPSGGTGTYTYGWSVISGAVALPTDTTTSSISISTGDTSFVQLRVTDGLGCVGLDTVKISNINLSVDASAKYENICAGLADTLFATPSGGIGGYSYTWTPTGASIASPVVNPTVDTDYSVTVYDSTTGCLALDTVSIYIYEFNAVAGAVGLDTLLRCYGETNDLNLNASLTNGGTAPYNYLWSTTDVTVNFVNNTSNPGAINRASAGDGSISTIQLLVTDNIGCTSVDSIKVLWNSEIITTVTPDISNAFADIVAVCVGVPKMIDNLSVSGGSGNYTYQWANPVSANGVFYTDGQNTSTPTVGANTIGAQRTLNITITDTPILGSTCPVQESMVVRAFDINVDLSVDEDTVCPNTEILLTATARDSVGFVAYQWNNSPIYTTSKTNLFNVGGTSTTTQVYVRDTLTGCTNFASVNIEVRELVASQPSRFPSGDICYEQKTVTLTGNATGGKPGGYTYEWKELPFNSVVLGTNDTVVISPPAVGTNDLTAYQLVVADLLGCTDTVQIGIRRYDSILVDAGLRDTVCINDGNVIVGGDPTAAYLSTTGADPSYSWSGGSFNSTISSNPRFIIQSEGVFKLQVVATIPNTSCSNLDSVFIEVKERPIADLSDETTFICADSSIVLHANSADINYVYPLTTTFEWRKQGVFGLLNPNPYADSVEVTSRGIYSVLVTNEFGCESSDDISIDSVVAPLIWARPIDTLECTNREIILTIDSLRPARSGELFGDTVRWEVLVGFGEIDDYREQTTFYKPFITDDSVQIEVTYTNLCGTGRDTVSARVAEAPVAIIDVNDSTINITETATFDGRSSFTNTGNQLLYNWSFNAPDMENEFFAGPFEKNYNPEGTYPAELVVTDKDTRCTDTARVNIYVNGTHLLYVPNVFSPNASNPENRTLKMYGFGVSDDDFIFTVYNRWGEKVYEQTSFSQAISIGWEGTYKNSGDQLDMGVYTYIVRARYVDGTPIEKVGTITLLR